MISHLHDFLGLFDAFPHSYVVYDDFIQLSL